jgi:uncharacterized protein HemY
MDNNEKVDDLVSNLAISTEFLRIEAQAHMSRGDKEKALACYGQVRQNQAALDNYLEATEIR